MPDIIYAHRNGESEPPTIHEKYYWFECAEESSCGQVDGCYYIYPYVSEDDPARLAGKGGKPIAKLEGRWWGPITPPWEQGNG